MYVCDRACGGGRLRVYRMAKFSEYMSYECWVRPQTHMHIYTSKFIAKEHTQARTHVLRNPPLPNYTSLPLTLATPFQKTRCSGGDDTNFRHAHCDNYSHISAPRNILCVISGSMKASFPRPTHTQNPLVHACWCVAPCVVGVRVGRSGLVHAGCLTGATRGCVRFGCKQTRKTAENIDVDIFISALTYSSTHTHTDIHTTAHSKIRV